MFEMSLSYIGNGKTSTIINYSGAHIHWCTNKPNYFIDLRFVYSNETSHRRRTFCVEIWKKIFAFTYMVQWYSGTVHNSVWMRKLYRLMLNKQKHLQLFEQAFNIETRIRCAVHTHTHTQNQMPDFYSNEEHKLVFNKKLLWHRKRMKSKKYGKYFQTMLS